MTSLTQWRIYCITESAWAYIWLDPNLPAPVTCPNNPAHTVNPNSTSINNSISYSQVKIVEETVKTGGNFRSEGRLYQIPSNQSVTQFSIPFAYGVNILTVWLNFNANNVGDTVNFYYQPYYMGTIKADITTPTNVVQVDPFTAGILYIGYILILKKASDGTTENLGEITNIDLLTGNITLTNSTTKNYTAGDGVLINVNGLKNITCATAGIMQCGGSKLGSTYIDKTGTIFGTYQNNTPSQAKTLSINIDYLY